MFNSAAQAAVTVGAPPLFDDTPLFEDALFQALDHLEGQRAMGTQPVDVIIPQAILDFAERIRNGTLRINEGEEIQQQSVSSSLASARVSLHLARCTTFHLQTSLADDFSSFDMLHSQPRYEQFPQYSVRPPPPPPQPIISYPGEITLLRNPLGPTPQYSVVFLYDNRALNHLGYPNDA